MECNRRSFARLFILAFLAIFISRGRMSAAPGDASEPGSKAAARAAKLTADIGTFTLRLNYAGEEDKPFYRLLLSVPAVVEKERDNPFHQGARITEAQAAKIVEFLAKDGFCDAALDGNRNRGPVPPKEPHYTLTVGVANGGNPIVFEEWLTFRPLLFQRLDGLQKLLDGEAAKGMEFLIARLNGYRRLLEKK